MKKPAKQKPRFRWIGNGQFMGNPIQEVGAWVRFDFTACTCEVWMPPRLTFDEEKTPKPWSRPFKDFIEFPICVVAGRPK